MIQTLAWAATLLGWAAAWSIGNGHRNGWAVSIIAAAAWVAVDSSFNIWAGVTSAAVAGGIAARNWRRA